MTGVKIGLPLLDNGGTNTPDNPGTGVQV